MTPDYEHLLGLLRARRSIRRFRPDPLPAGTAERLVEAARWAPSAGNRQAWRFLAVEHAETRAAMARAVAAAVESLRAGVRADRRAAADEYLSNFGHFAQAPLVLVALHRAGPDLLRRAAEAPPATPGAEANALASVAAAIQNLLLAAHALGLGACWMTGPLVAAPALSALLAVPAGWAVSAVIPVGYADETPPAPPRRDLARLLRATGEE